jgi:hypothetical protein
LANGLYNLRVSLLTADHQPLPGRSAQAPFFVGAPVSASVSADPILVPPGTSTVSTNLTVMASTQQAEFDTKLLHQLPASGYLIDPASINPTADEVSASRVTWTEHRNTTEPLSLHFHLSGQVQDMRPGELREISLGTEVQTTTLIDPGNNELLNLSNWTVVQYDLPAQGPAS